jgi:hypothetical protein
MVCHNYRRIPAVALAKQMIAAGELGSSIRHFHARYAQDWLVNPNVPVSWKLQKASPAPARMATSTRISSTSDVTWLGEIKEVCGMMETFIKERPLEAGQRSRRGPRAAKRPKSRWMTP